jgi:hypothetical protein
LTSEWLAERLALPDLSDRGERDRVAALDGEPKRPHEAARGNHARVRNDAELRLYARYVGFESRSITSAAFGASVAHAEAT